MTGEVVVSRNFTAPIERVFSALTDPDELVQWWGPRGIRHSRLPVSPVPDEFRTAWGMALVSIT